MLAPNEEKQLVELLGKIENPHGGLPITVFLALTKIVPYVACELVIVNDKKELFLTWREDEYWKGWHFPGGLIRFGEEFEDRIRSVAKEELGVSLGRYDFLSAVNVPDGPRGHIVSLVFLCRAVGVPKGGTWFKNAPPDLISHHKRFLPEIQMALSRE